MGSTCGNSNHCLFCGTPTDQEDQSPSCSPLEIDETGEVVVKEEKAGNATDRLIEDNGRAIFIVRQLLDIPVEKCAGYLQHNDGEEHPASWFRVCTSCSKSVEEGYKVYCGIARLQNKLVEIKRNLRSLIVIDERRWHKRRKSRSRETEYVYHGVRDYVASESDPSDKVEDQTTCPGRRRSARKRKVFTEIDVPMCSELDLESIPDFCNDPSASDPLPSPDHLHEDYDDNDCNDADWQPIETIPSDGKIGVKLEDECPKKRKKRHHRKNRKLKVRRKVLPIPELETLTQQQKVMVNEIQPSLTTLESVMPPSPTAKVRVTYMNKCDLCVAIYKTTGNFNAHRKLHDNNEGEPCPYCGWLCKKNCIPHHISRRHRGIPPSRKRKRTYKTKKPTKYRHLRVVKEDIPFYCDNCHMIFPFKRTLLKHITLNHPGSLRLSCTICNSSGFETKQILELHCRDEHPSEAGQSLSIKQEESQPQICPHCSKPFPSKLSMDYHIAKFHKEELVTCKVCGYRAKKYSKYVQHYNLKHDNERYMCEMCAKSFATKQYLKCHMNMEHHVELGLDPLICKECNVTFPNNYMMNTHIESVHKKLKQHCCEFCGKAFSRVCDMRKHILLHTEPRERQYKQGPFFCEFCQAKFNVRQGLYYHLKRLHSDQYAFKCDICETGYATQNTLSQHQRKCKRKLQSSTVDMTEQKADDSIASTTATATTMAQQNYHTPMDAMSTS